MLGCLLAIAGAVILCKTWRVLEVKRGGQDRKALAMVGSGGMTARANPALACADGPVLLCCFEQERPRLPRPEPPWHSSVSTSPWRSSRCVRLRVIARVFTHVIKCAPVHVGALPALTRTTNPRHIHMDGTRWCGRALQLVPYVKTMFGAVMALRSACSQAVHNKERCAALAECVRVAAHPRVAHGAECVRASGIRVGPIDRAHACVRSLRALRGCYRCAPLRAPLRRARSGRSLYDMHNSARRCCRWLEGLCTVL